MRIKSTIAIAALVTACLMLDGCDFLRKVAGRPTSAQIEAEVARRAEQEEQKKRQEQERLEAERLQAERDSVSKAQEASAGVAEAVAVVASKPQGHYYVVVGAYQSRQNAEKKKKRMEAAGCKAVIVTVRDGLKAVAVCPSATRQEAVSAMSSLRRRGLCPEAAWILKLDR